MAADIIRKIIRAGFVLSFLPCCPLSVAAQSGSQMSPFAANEVRSMRERDQLRLVKTALKDGTDGVQRHSAAVSDAFRGTDDWAQATERYYARKDELVTRAAVLEDRLAVIILRNAPERAENVVKALDEFCKESAVLRADFELYTKLPRIAEGTQRRWAQATMRLLAETGSYPIALAYFLDKLPNRPPFAPLTPGLMYSRRP